MPTAIPQEQLLEIIKNNVPLGFSIVDQDGVIVDFNTSAEIITGYKRHEVLGKSHFQILHNSSGPESCPLLQEVIARRKSTLESESTITNRDGELIVISVTAFPIVDETGRFLGGVEIFRDVTGQKKLERERENILSMFAHDMKNPIITSEGFISRLIEEKAGKLSEKQKNYLKTIDANLHKVEGLISNFLEFSKFESREYKPRLKPFDLGDAVRNVIESARIEAEKKNIQILVKSPGRPWPIQADAMMIERVITNLLGNAINYSLAGGGITIELSETESDIIVQVADTGTGIAEEHLPHIFDAFFRGRREVPGTGLGLTISKSIIEAHRGRIWVQSSAESGTTFTFRLPKGMNRSGHSSSTSG